MKYRNQLRWLLFLLIPFFSMLCVHILVPLEIASNSHALLNQDYSFDNINLSQKSLQSLSIVSSNTITNILDKYVYYLRLFGDLKTPQYKYLIINESVSINSAYQFVQQNQNNIKGTSNNKNISMWFATNISQVSEFSKIQQDMYNQYKSKQLFLRVFFSQSLDSTFSRISTLYVSSNQSIVFSFPTQYNANYANLSSSTIGSPFSSILNAIQVDNLTYTVDLSVGTQPQSNVSLLAICQGLKNNGLVEITCIELKMNELALIIQSSINLGKDISSLAKTYLIANIHSSASFVQSEPQIIFAASKESTGILSTTPFLNLNPIGLTKDLVEVKPYSHENKIYANRFGNYMNSLTSLSLCTGQKMTAMMSILTVNEFQQMRLQSVNLQQNLNALIIPIVILIIIGSLVSAIFLKVLLDSIDKELFELDHRCKFIVEGDINIEIPEYKGTQDIKELYEKVKIINKLHRYTVSSYFSGHFAQKVLKYNEALQFLSHLGYDIGNVLENMGESQYLVEQWQKSISSLKKSVDLALNELKSKFNLTMDDALKMKIQRKALPYGYKQLEVIIMRRLFKLNFSYIKFVELRQIAVKTVLKSEETAFNERLEALTKQWTYYLGLQKKAFYPDFSSYSECIISLTFEAKQYANLKQFDESFKLLESATKFQQIYTEQYSEVTKKLKEKGSKFKLLHQKNRLTAHSRTSPQILKSLRNLTAIKIMLNYRKDLMKYNEAIQLYGDGVKVGVLTLSVGYLITIEFRKFLVDLKIDPFKYETTQIFKQCVPFKTLYYGEITKEIQPQILKFPTKISLGLERQFILIVDCARNRDKKEDKLLEYFSERSDHLFQKLIKGTDRLSIIKFNLKSGIKVECKLTLKQSNEVILKKELRQSFKDPNQSRGSFPEMVEVLYLAVNRVRGLQSEKVIVMYFKNIAHYAHLNERLRKKKKTQGSLKLSKMDDLLQFEKEETRMSEFGDHIVEIMNSDELRNCKLILHCANNDAIEEFRAFFGLGDINRRIWKDYNRNNNIVYIIEEKHKSDLDRILMLKAQIPADNHVFIL